jgi:hypothetical protein
MKLLRYITVFLNETYNKVQAGSPGRPRETDSEQDTSASGM